MLFYQMRRHYLLCSRKMVWPAMLGQCTPSGLAEKALLRSHSTRSNVLLTSVRQLRVN